MLTRRRSAILGVLGCLFWLADVAAIRWVPIFVIDPFWGDLAFFLSISGAAVCVTVARRLAALDVSRVVPGSVLLVLVPALLHAAALRWAPAIYGGDHAGRLGSAWLLWIYGLILGFALLRSRETAPSYGRLTLWRSDRQ